MFFLKLLAVLLSLRSSSSLFFGANVALPQAKDLSSAVNKCSTAAEQISPSLCKVVKTLLKFDRSDYVAASNSLVDIEYIFEDVQGFYSNFLHCLNEQTQAQTADTSIRNIESLIYQLDVYVITGMDGKLSNSAEALGAVFGQNVKAVIVTIATQLSQEFSIVKASLETIRDNFQVTVDSGSEITAGSLSSDISSMALVDMVTAFKDIAVSSNQLNTMIASFVSITSTLETIATSIQTVRDLSLQMITKANYELDVSIQASRKLFTKNTLALESSVSDSFGEFLALVAQLFTGDTDIQDSRGKVDAFAVAIVDAMEKNNEVFITSFSDFLTTISGQIQTLRQNVFTSTQQVIDFLIETVARNSASFIKCLGSSTNNAVMALQLIRALGVNSSQCINSQSRLSLQAQSLMTFITEDVVLNSKGVADKLCGCSVKGNSKVMEVTKKCIKKVTDDMESNLIADETTYLETEMGIVQANITMSIEAFQSCSEGVSTAFEESFQKLQETVNACVAVR